MISHKGKLFLGYLFLTAIALGCFFSGLAPHLPMPAPVLFLFGATLTPFVLGHWLLLLTTIRKDWTPPLAAAVPLCLLLALNVAVFAVKGMPLPLFTLPSFENAAALACAAVFLYQLLRVLLHNTSQANHHHDANLYIGQALHILRTRSLDGLRDFETNIPSVGMSNHGLSYTGYVAFARSFLGMMPDMEKDDAPKLALQANILFFAISVFAFSLGTLGTIWGAALATMLVFCVPGYGYMSEAFSRDPYRISVALFLAAALVYTAPSLDTNGIACMLPLLFLLTYLTLDAHTLGAILIAVFGGAWSLLALYKAQASAVVPAGLVWLACGLGFALAARKYVVAYKRTGALWGYIPIRYAVAETVLDSHVNRRATLRLTAQTRKQKLREVFARDQFRLSVAGVVSALVLTACARLLPVSDGLLFAASVSILLFLPTSGLLDFSVYKISDWFAINIRYLLHWYPFVSVATVGLGMILLSKLQNWIFPFAAWIPIIAALLTTLHLSVKSISKWKQNLQYASAYFEHFVSILKILSDADNRDGSIVMSEFNFAPYLPCRPGYIYTKSYWPVLQSKTPDMARIIIKKKGIRFFVFFKRDVTNWLELLPFYASLKQHGERIHKDKHLEVWMCN